MKRLTSADWLTSRQPADLLLGLRERSYRVPHLATPDRKLRLFAVACCRRVWPVLTAVGRKAVERAERTCDSGRLAGRLHLGDFYHLVVQSEKDRMQSRRLVAEAVDIKDALSAALETSLWAVCTDPSQAFEESEQAAQADLLRCIVGNPFRPVAFAPVWRTSTVVALATGVYEDRAFDRLPVLADALADAGCDHAELLAHLRGPGPHARGCWPVDLILGKT